MKRIYLGLVLVLVALVAVPTVSVKAATCVNVPTSRGSMTAYLPASGGTVSGGVDAHGCDIGVYVMPGGNVTISGADVHDADRFGIFVDGATAVITSSQVHDIGNHSGGVFTPNGVQTGIGIYVLSDLQPSSVQIDGNSVTAYQKGGIVVNGDRTTASVTGNTVTGLGQVNYIAQNGIQVSRGASGEVRGNWVSDNFYTGSVGVGPNPGGQNPPGWEYVSGGVLLYQPGAVLCSQNFFTGNQRNLIMVP